jgi:hypothetical protein
MGRYCRTGEQHQAKSNAKAYHRVETMQKRHRETFPWAVALIAEELDQFETLILSATDCEFLNA